MPNIRLLSVFLAVVLCGCSSIDGLYAPACMAYEGDEIELADGRFTWRRFTDQRTLDERGELLDPFPAYPISGSYEHRDPILTLVPDEEKESASFYLRRDKRGVFLLTGEQNQQYIRDGEFPECALRQAPQKSP